MRVARKIGLALAVLVLFVALGCTKQVVIPDEVKHEYTYGQALKFFNDTVESYTFYLEQADPATQATLIEKVNPVIKEANDALDKWGLALNSATSRQAYLDLERQMMRLFFTYGVPKLKGGT
jgi:hypothetical protein